MSVSFVSAVRDKYCPDDDQSAPDLVHATRINETALKLGPGGCPMERRRSVVLDRAGVDCTGDKEQLKQLCPLVEEAHLCGNELTQWKDILDILHSLPKLSFLDLTRNPLKSETFVRGEVTVYPNLTCLALNYTNIQWTAIESCLQLAPNLTELHLAQNNYSTVDLTPGVVHTSLKQLHIQNNAIKDWKELAKLSNTFVELQTLVASDNPLSSIDEVSREHFPKLLKLSLNNTPLSDWVSIEQLSQLTHLKELNVLRIAVAEDLTDKIRRFAVVARMPALVKLNKSDVTCTEREDAERWMLREFESSSDRPSLYSKYQEKHGVLYQLVEVNLKPRTSIQLEFHFNDGRGAVTRDVKLKQTVLDLKKWVGRELVGNPAAKITLNLRDDTGWRSSLTSERRSLHSYTELRDGDQIHIHYTVCAHAFR